MLHPVQFYRDIVGTSDPSLIAKFGTAAWWGGQGNTLPATVRTSLLCCLSRQSAERSRQYDSLDWLAC